MRIIAMQWDARHRRLLLIAPHWLDRREPTYEERGLIRTLDDALEHLGELRAGVVGRFRVRRVSLAEDDDLLRARQSWMSLTPYAVTRHKNADAAEVLTDDVLFQCRERHLPRPQVTVLSARGVPGKGLEGMLRLDFATAVTGPIVLGRTRYLGGGLFAPREKNNRVLG
jgi:CRISPR-associated protein Csb2